MKSRNLVRFMGYTTLLVVAVALAWSLVIPLFEGGDAGDRAVITWIIDGDTFVIKDRERVRLLGIDAPESAPNDKLESLVRKEGRDRDSIIALGKAALRFCIERYKDKPVRMVRDGIQPDRDDYGRFLRYLYLEDGTCINEELIREGYALVYRRFDFNKREEFLAAEREAKRMGKGMWKDG